MSEKLHKLTNVILLILFITCILVFFIILIDAFLNIRSSNSSINSSIKNIEELLKNDSLNLATDNQEIKLNIQEMKNVGKSTLDSNTVSFLFEMFTIALIGAGIYLLTRTNDNQRKIKKKAEKTISNLKKVYPLISKNHKSIIIGNYLSEAYQISELFKMSLQKDTTLNFSLIANLRTFTGKALNMLSEEEDLAIIIHNDLTMAFIDRVTFTKTNLENIIELEEDYKTHLNDILNDCIAILKLLENKASDSPGNRLINTILSKK